jgi:hypothetical protein
MGDSGISSSPTPGNAESHLSAVRILLLEGSDTSSPPFLLSVIMASASASATVKALEAKRKSEEEADGRQVVVEAVVVVAPLLDCTNQHKDLILHVHIAQKITSTHSHTQITKNYITQKGYCYWRSERNNIY